MIQSLFALILLSIASILADHPLVLSPRHIQRDSPIEVFRIDGKVYSQAYNWDLLDNGVSIYSGGNRWFCDDFQLDGDYYITDIYTWVIWTGEQASEMNLVISEDDANDSDPNTNTDVWVESIPCTSTFTGDSNWGYDIYRVHCVIDADIYPELSADTHYYLEIQAETNDNVFSIFSWVCVEDCAWWDDGDGIWVSMDTWWSEVDAFFVFLGEPISALEQETWGSIKTLF